MRRPSIAPVLLVAAILAAAAVYVVPRGIEARALLTIADDPAGIADRALDEKFDAALATRDIERALADDDTDLANSFVNLAAARQVAIAPALTEKVDAAIAKAATAQHASESFAQGLVTGEPKDAAGLAGTTLGDLFLFGDVRDAVREAGRMAMGEPADELLLGLACVGLAITAGTYATLGASAPARVGLSAAKVARKTGRFGADMSAAVTRMLHGIVDWGRLKNAIVGASISEPALVIHAARDAVKIERAGGLVRLVRNIGRVQAKAGTQAALDGLKIAESPREMGRIAKLAEKAGARTRAILKTAGRGAIVLSVASFDLGLWILGALFTAFALVSSLKSTTERITRRWLWRRNERRLQRYVALAAQGQCSGKAWPVSAM